MPVRDDRTMFEMLTLEGAQAGLSWETILRKRDGYREAFGGFDPARVARFSRGRIERLLAEPAIVRNRLKVESTVTNARAVAQLARDYPGDEHPLCAHLWSFVGGEPIVNAWTGRDAVPTTTPIARAMSRDLKQRGFRFVGPTICYALMQAAGLVNDHTTDCFRWSALGG